MDGTDDGAVRYPASVCVLAATAAEAAPKEPLGRHMQNDGGGSTILVVEDEMQVRELSRRVLERSGYTVLAASDAEAVQGLETERLENEHVERALNDVGIRLVHDASAPRVCMDDTCATS